MCIICLKSHSSLPFVDTIRTRPKSEWKVIRNTQFFEWMNTKWTLKRWFFRGHRHIGWGPFLFCLTSTDRKEFFFNDSVVQRSGYTTLLLIHLPCAPISWNHRSKAAHTWVFFCQSWPEICSALYALLNTHFKELTVLFFCDKCSRICTLSSLHYLKN